jgi:hypothetical protein
MAGGFSSRRHRRRVDGNRAGGDRRGAGAHDLAPGREVLGDRRKATVAAAFLLASPFFLVHSGTYLNYLFTLLLETLFTYLVVRGTRSRSRVCLVLAGLALGAALLTRPFDCLLIAIPVLLYAVVAGRGDARRLAATFGWLAAGFVGPLAGALALNVSLTGHVFTFPEAVNGGIQTFGFGPKRLAQGTHLVNYSFGTAIRSLGHNLVALPKWFFGGLVAVVLALWGAARPRLGTYRVLLVGLAAVFPIGYIFWWGSYLSVGAGNSIGPHYYLPMMLPVAILAADVTIDLFRQRALVAWVVLAAMVGVTVVELPIIYSATTALPKRFARDDKIVQEARLRHALVFLPRAADQEPYVLHPFPYLTNTPDLSGPVLYASEHGPGNFDLLDRYPKRIPYRFTSTVEEGQNILHGTYQVIRLSRLSSAALSVDLDEVNPSSDATLVLAYASLNGRVVTASTLATQSRKGDAYDVRWSLGPAVLRELGAGGQPVMTTAIGRAGTLAFGLAFGRSESPARDELVEQRVTYRATPDAAEVLMPGEEWHQIIYGRAFWIPERGTRYVKHFTLRAAASPTP